MQPPDVLLLGGVVASCVVLVVAAQVWLPR
jgi:hypothetical protein